jgi:tetratricopeptide (TPR) repeat protein
MTKRSLRKAIELNPKYAIGYYNLGVAIQRQRKLDEAIAAYRRIRPIRRLTTTLATP